MNTTETTCTKTVEYYLPPRLVNISGTSLHYDATTGQIGPSVSSQRFKREITDSEIDTSTLYNLIPSEFTLIGDSDDGDYGFIAEEVDKIMPKLVTYDSSGPYSIRYDMLSTLLLPELKKIRDNVNLLLERVITLEEGSKKGNGSKTS